MRRVEISWLDAAFMLDEDAKDLISWKRHGGMRAKTIGYVLEDSDLCIIVAAEVFEDDTKRGLTVIPKGMITKITELSCKKSKKS